MISTAPIPNRTGKSLALRKRRYCVQLLTAAIFTINFLINQRRSQLHHIINSHSNVSPISKPKHIIRAEDESCPFKNSPLYRSVYIYPTPDFTTNRTGLELSKLNPIYSPKGGTSPNQNGYLPPYPWLHWDNVTKTDEWGHYDVSSQMGQYTLELIVRDILTHPSSCLSTPHPDEAKLFYVPYLPSMEFHKGRLFVADYSTTEYGKAISAALEGQYDLWEEYFGFTSKYWERNHGADHILVWSEPLHGFSHPRMKRGNHHYIYTQRLLRPAIGIVVEVSTTFVEMYPRCAAKNILVPYPNPDGRWMNGKLDEDAAQWHAGKTSQAEERKEEKRPASYWYSSGNHGTCANLRRIMMEDYRCTSSHNTLQSRGKLPSYLLGMRLSKICPCPGGDSPSAKRNFDSVLAGCVPLILSHDFVWPYTKEFDPALDTDPNEFSIRLPATEYTNSQFGEGCTILNNNTHKGLPSHIDSIIGDATEMQRLQNGVAKARDLYSFYSRSQEMPNNPLREGVLPDGGAAHALVDALASRIGGERWTQCEEELAAIPQNSEEVKSFKC